ncbi:MAG: DUF1987 domain-containing protein [Bacteroidota bacterium]
MEDFVLEATKFTPEIRLGLDGDFSFTGDCFPSSRRNFFVPVYDWVEEFLHKQNPEKIHVRFDLIFLDTASVQSFLRLLQILDDYREEKESEIEITVEWLYEEDDLDMLGLGENYQEDVKLPIELVQIPIRE